MEKKVNFKKHLLDLVGEQTEETRDAVAKKELEKYAKTHHTCLKPVVIRPRVEDFESVKIINCMECGAQYKETKSSDGTCRECGNDKSVNEWYHLGGQYQLRDTPFLYVLKADADCVYFAHVEPVVCYDEGFEKPARIEGDFRAYGYLAHDKLAFYTDKNGLWFHRGGTFEWYKKQTEKFRVVCADKEVKSGYRAFISGSSWKNAVATATQPKPKTELKPKASRKPVRLEDVALPEVDTKKIMCQGSIARTKSESARKRTYMVYCQACHATFEHTCDPGETPNLECPECGYKSHVWGNCAEIRGYGVAVNSVTVNDLPYLVVRAFRKVLRDVDWETGQAKEECTETEKCFFSEKDVKYYVFDGKWVKKPASSVRGVFGWLMQSLEEIRRNVAVGPAVFNALPEAIAYRTNTLTGSVDTKSMINYLKECLEKPQIVAMAKCGLTNLATSWNPECDDLIANRDADSVTEFLGVTEGQLAVLQEANPSIHEMRGWKDVFATVPDTTAEEYAMARETIDGCVLQRYGSAFLTCLSDVLRAIRTLKRKNIQIRLTDVAKYLKACFDEQCIEAGPAIRDWLHYLDAAVELYDLSDKAVLYPRELRHATDVARFAAYRAGENKKQEKTN